MRILNPTARTTGAWMARNQDPENFRDRARQNPKGTFIRKMTPATDQRL